MQSPIIFLHGAIGTSHQMNILRNFHHTSYTFDFRGHGQNDKSVVLSIPSFSDDLLAFMTTQQLSKVHIVGYSMGGYVGLYFAAHYPELISSVTCIGTKFDWNTKTAEKESSFLNPEKILNKVPAFAQKLKNEHGDKWKDLLVSTAEMLRGMGENPPLSQAVLEKIQAPILLMCGDRDETAVPLENLKTYHTLKDLKKTVELAILPNTVHAIEKIPTTLTNNILELFLNRY